MNFSTFTRTGFKIFGIFVFILGVLGRSEGAFGQASFIHAELGTTAYSMTATSDGGFATIGQNIAEYYSSAEVDMGQLIKFDDQGCIEWERNYEEFQNGLFIHQTEENHYILGVQKLPQFCNGCHLGLVEVDEFGAVLWEQYYNFGDDSNKSFLENATPTEEGFILVGRTSQGSLGNAYVVHTDREGNIVWERTYDEADEHTSIKTITPLIDDQFAIGRDISANRVEIIIIDIAGNPLSSFILDAHEEQNIEQLSTNAMGEIIGIGNLKYSFFDEYCFDEYTGEYGCWVWKSEGWYFKIGLDGAIVWEYQLEDETLLGTTAFNDSTFRIIGTRPGWGFDFCFGPCHDLIYFDIADETGSRSNSRTISITGDFTGDTPHDVIPFAEDGFVICGVAGETDLVGYERLFVLGDIACTDSIPDIGPPLPIELATFSGEAQTKGNLLHWTTLSEIDNDHFRILRSTDGQYFEEIGRTNGAGNSHTAKHYAFLDAKPLAAISYYQLQSVDFTGTLENSQMISIHRTTFDTPAPVFEAYPNPVHHTLTLTQSQPKGEATYTLYNILGKKVMADTFSTAAHTLDMEHLPNGVYFLHVKNGDGERTLRVVKE